MSKNNTLLKKLKLENFKCYQNTTINFKSTSIIVGENNAGKSCLIEALRIVSRAAHQFKSRTYIDVPSDFELQYYAKGFSIDVKKLKIDLSSIIYFYTGAKYAKIIAYFNDKSRIEIYLNDNKAFAIIYDQDGINVKSRSQAAHLEMHKIGILPQIGPIRENEKYISDETVINDKDTYLSSLHFRNEIYLWKREYFEDFKNKAEKTWSGLKIEKIDFIPVVNEYINLFVEDNRFTAEIGKMGNGLQMWLQIIWFLARSKDCEVIILDEPDVYMHPDMQRKIVELVQSEFPQVIIATHSTEIISRVSPDNILEINKSDKTMHYASDSESVQKIIDDIGSIYNLSLLNIGRQRRCLFVEGKDADFLNRINERLFGKRLDIPIFTYGGFCNISRLYGASNLFYKETHDQIKCYALADKDYRDERIVDVIISEAIENKLNLHIWKKKEIENYLLIPSVLYSFIPKNKEITYEAFCEDLNEILDRHKDLVFDSYSSQYRNDSKNLSGSQWDNAKCNASAREYLMAHWTDLEDKLSLVCGKDFLGEVFDYFKSNYNVSLSSKKIIDCITKDNISKEMLDFLSMIN